MNRNSTPVLAIDGPAAAGKTTISKWVSATLGWRRLESGELYRWVAADALAHELQPSDADQIAWFAADLNIAKRQHQYLRPTPELDRMASIVSAMEPVREALLELQRTYRREPGLVAEGRDMGTVVFPDAMLKVFLTATPEARALRRCNQLPFDADRPGYEETLAAIKERDERDKTRSVAPLVQAEDAIVIDSTGDDVAATAKVVFSELEKRGITPPERGWQRSAFTR